MDREAMSIERIWELLSDRLRSFLIHRVSDEQVAEDLLQETFLRIHQKLASIDDRERITAWVFQIARNLVVDYYRSKGRHDVHEMGDVRATEDDDGNLNEMVQGWLKGMIARLPERYRQAVELYELEGVGQQEIADRLGISLSGTKSRVQRGRAKLKAMLFDCCSFERDRRGNIIGYVQIEPGECDVCDEGCES